MKYFLVYYGLLSGRITFIFSYGLHDMDCKTTLSIYELAPHPADKPLPPRPPRSVNPRDLEIYRLHTVEKKTIRELANIHDISMQRVWEICTCVRKYGINESIEEKAPFTGSLSLAETM